MPARSSISQEPPSVPTPEELRGWKEIAAYLGVDVRTAQRYEQESALPVKRLEGGARGRVYAALADIEKWKQASTQIQPWWNRIDGLRRALTAATVVAAVLGVALIVLVWPTAGRAVRFGVEGLAFVAYDADGETVWRYQLPHQPRTEWDETHDYGNPPVLLGDANGDGETEVLYWYRSRSYETPDILFCFTDRGEKLWEYTPDLELSTPASAFSGEYHLRAFRFLGTHRPETSAKGVVTAFVNAWGYPSIVAAIDPDGKVVGEYAHAGHIEDVFVRDLDGDGQEEVLASGFSETRNMATAVVLDPTKLNGASIEPSDSDLRIIKAPTSEGELLRLLFPTTAVTADRGGRNLARDIFKDGDRIVIKVHEHRAYGTNRVRIDYVFDSQLRLLSAIGDINMRLAYEEARGTDPTVPALDDAELERLGSLIERIPREQALKSALH